MKRRTNKRLAGLVLTVISCAAALAGAQDQRGDWAMTGGDAAQSGWQKDELGLAPDTIASKFKYLWRIKLGQPSNGTESFNEPLLIGRVINGQGFKDFVFSSSADTLYGVDSELGSLIWKKQFTPSASSSGPAAGCEASRLGLLMEPPVTINFNARRKRPPGTPRPPDPPPAQGKERKLGVAPGGGYFGFKGIYVLTADGMLHEQIVTTGADFAPPVKFLPAANALPYGLNFVDKVIYTATGHGCGGVENGLWSTNLLAGDYPVKSYDTGKVQPLALTGPVVTAEGTALLITGQASPGSTPAIESHPGSVISVGKDMAIQDWYTPSSSMANYEYVSPIVIDLDKRRVVLTPGADGKLALLNLTSLGGADHHTPSFETSEIFKPGRKHAWDGFATWTEKDGTLWVFASVSTPISLGDANVKSNGTATHGGIVAFKVDDVEGKASLRPVWVSEDMINPAPPRVANGVVVELAGGDSSSHAVLHVLNATTGADLYSSKDEISTYTHLSGVAVGDSHAFFTDHDNVLYSFGIALEH